MSKSPSSFWWQAHSSLETEHQSYLLYSCVVLVAQFACDARLHPVWLGLSFGHVSLIKYKREDNARTDGACSQKYAQLSQAKREKLIRNMLVVHRLRH